MTASGSLLEIEPTVFFTRNETDVLGQLAYLNLENRGPAGELELSPRSAGF